MSGTSTAASLSSIINARHAIIIDTRSSHARGRGNKHKARRQGESPQEGVGRNPLNGLNDDWY